MTQIDTTKPLEVYNTDTGERVAVKFNYIDYDGDIIVRHEHPRARVAYHQGGEAFVGGSWRLRNIPDPEPIDWSNPDKLELSDGTRVTRMEADQGRYNVWIAGECYARTFRKDGCALLPDDGQLPWPVNGRTVRMRKADATGVSGSVSGKPFDHELSQLRTRNAELEKELSEALATRGQHVGEIERLETQVASDAAWKAAAIEKHGDLAFTEADRKEARKLAGNHRVWDTTDDYHGAQELALLALQRGRELSQQEGSR
jgi:hypothetical protein